MNRRQLLQLCFGLVASLPFVSLFRSPRLQKYAEDWIVDFYGKTTRTVSGSYTKAGLWIDEASIREEGYQREIEKLVEVPVGFERSYMQYTLMKKGAVQFTFTDTAIYAHKGDLLTEQLHAAIASVPTPALLSPQRTS